MVPTISGIIMSAFIICWLPFFVLALVRPFLQDPNSIPMSISSLFLWLGYANSTLNPIIYATLNKDFRKPFQVSNCMNTVKAKILRGYTILQFHNFSFLTDLIIDLPNANH